MSYQIAGLLLNGLSLIRVDWSAAVLTRLFFTVFKAGSRPWVDEFWQSADERRELTVVDSKIPFYRWGEGPLVVLMHGWSGSGTQFRYFVPPLVAAGFSVVGFDAPGHGGNPGRQSDLLRFSGSLCAVQQGFGPVFCVIAHSFGGMATCYAQRHGLDAARLVLIAPQLDVNGIFETFRELLHMGPKLAERFRERISERMLALGVPDPWSEFEPSSLLAIPGLRGMLVYDEDDPEIALSQFERFASLWSGSLLHKTRGLGHNRILRDDGVITAIVDYLKS